MPRETLLCVDAVARSSFPAIKSSKSGPAASLSESEEELRKFEEPVDVDNVDADEDEAAVARLLVNACGTRNPIREMCKDASASVLTCPCMQPLSAEPTAHRTLTLLVLATMTRCMTLLIRTVRAVVCI